MAQGNREKKRKISGGTVAVIVLAVIVVVSLVGVLGLGAYVAGRDTIYPNVTVSGVNIGGMSYDKAHSTLLNAELGVPAGVKATAKLTDLVSVTVTSEEAGLTYSVTDAVDAAYAYGRGGGFFANMFSYLSCLRAPHEISTEARFNESGVRAIIADKAGLANHDATDASWQISGDELLITRGDSGYTVDEEAVYIYIKNTLLSGVSDETDRFSEASAGGVPGGEPDFDAIYEQVHKEPQNAYFDAGTGTAVASVRGVSFDVAAAKELFSQIGPGETIAVPLIYTDPEVSDNEISDLLFRDKLAEYNTTLSTSTANRINNVSLAAKAIDGKTLNPGEEFSFNGVVGKRSAEKGYKEATGYAGGVSVPMIGGGICQVSSTLYYCTLMTDMEIVSRRNHGLTVTYMPAGLDATVSWGTIDFKFRNNKNYPIQIKAWVKNKRLYVELWGTREDDITIQLESNILQTIKPSVEERVDESLAPGKTKVIEKGKNGCVSEAYKLYYDGDGNLLRRVLISKDTYAAEKRIVAVGPERSEPAGPGATTPKPTESAPTQPGPSESEPTQPEPSESGPTESEPTEPEPTESEPTETEPTQPEPTQPEPTDEPTEPVDSDDLDPDPSDEEDFGDEESGDGGVG